MRNTLFITPREQQLVYGKFIFLLSSSIFKNKEINKTCSLISAEKYLTQHRILQFYSICKTGGLAAQTPPKKMYFIIAKYRNYLITYVMLSLSVFSHNRRL